MKQRIQWVNPIEEQLNNDELLSQRVWAVLPIAFCRVFFALLFLLTAVMALQDTYEELKADGGYVAMAVMLFFVVSMVLEMIMCYAGARKRLWAAGILCCIGVFYGGELLWEQRAQEPFSVGMMLLFIFLVVLWLAGVLRKNSLLLLPASGAIVLQLLNGSMPGKGAWFLFLTGILFCCTMGWEKADMQTSFLHGNHGKIEKRDYMWLVRGVVFTAVCGILFWVGDKPAQKTVDKHAGSMVTMVEEVLERVTGGVLWERLDLPQSVSSMAATMFRDDALDEVPLNNSALEYQQVEVLWVEMSDMPKENIYLRGFCGDTYDAGVWMRDLTHLERKCQEDDHEYDAARAQIAFLTARKLEGQVNALEESQKPNLRQLRVFYTGLYSEQVYMPYFAQVAAKGIGLVGDSGFTKDEKLKTLYFRQWDVSGEGLPSMISEKTDWDLWYEEYVQEQYLKVPTELSIVAKVAAEIAMNMESSEQTVNAERLTRAQAVAEWLAQNTTYSLNPPILTEGTDPITYFLGTAKTGYCMHYASAAVMLLRQLEVPARYASGYMVEADSFQWQEGWSAPEQSADGIDVSNGACYAASVTDERAHAWVEVYLDAIGWVPVEVTPGYPVIVNTMVLSEKMQAQEPSGIGAFDGETTWDGNKAEEMSGNDEASNDEVIGEIVQSGEVQPEKAPEQELDEDIENIGEELTDTEESEASEEENEEDNSLTEDSLEEDVTEESSESEQAVVGEDTSEEKKIVMVTPPPAEEEEIRADTRATTRKIIVYILCGLVVIGVLVALVADTHRFFRRESVYYKQLRKEMKRGNHKRVIMMINNGVYRKLYFKKLLAKGDGDEAYAKALKENYKQLSEEEWDNYMVIVKKVAFSEAEFTKEDVKFCFDVFRDVIYKDEVW